MSPTLRIAVLLLLGLAVVADPAAAQRFQIPANATPEQREAFERAMRRRRAARSGQPSQESKSDKKENDKKKEEKNDDGKKKEDDKDKNQAKPVTRPDEPPRPPDPRELEAKPDASGRVTFSFYGQPWADVLEWLARVSGLSLDWRELPGDYLNLSTQRAYALPEARDLINRHLQARGYALLLSGEVLSVVKLDAVEPSLVPRVTEEELYDRQPHDLVKLSLALPPGLEVKQAVEDVKQALGPHAKVMPLAATKRLLMIDTVANLRMVCAVLGEERMAVEGRVAPREFVLEHVQAPAVIDILYVVLGLDPNSRPSQMELRMQQQKLQLMQQLAQRGSKDVAKLLKKDGPPVYLAYNRQRNSVLVNAPEKEMRIIERTIKSLDVPVGGAEASAAASGERRFHSYRLKTIKPQAVLDTLREIGDLGPRTELQGDDASKTLFARATERDHAKIAALVKQLDGAETVVEVFWLRRLPAEAVAGSIQSLIINKPQEKKEDDYPWFFRRRRNEKKEEPATLLRVDADIENNRLIVRGTPQQLDEVRDLLVKLGEPLPGEPDKRRVRVLDALPEGETERLLERLREAWPEVGGESELILPEAATEVAPPEEPAEEEKEKDQEETTNRVTSASSGSPFRLLAASEDADKPTVRVEVDQSGRIVLRSDDPAALDRLEALVDELAPAPKRYEVFPVRNRNPDDLVASLKIYFEEFLKPEDEQVRDWYTGRMRGVKSEDEPVRLSRRKPLRFLSDDWSSTILVANASPAQLDEIRRLIDAWDREPIDDRVITRRTATVKLRFAKAKSVVAAIKEVYRDLLSRGDKEFDTAERKATSTSLRYLTQIRHGEDGLSDAAFIGFDGLLSLGADEAANVVILSARQEVFSTVLDAINDLDEQARPTTTVQVRSLPGGASAELKQALVKALQNASVGANQQGQTNRQQDGQQRRRRPQRRGPR